MDDYDYYFGSDPSSDYFLDDGGFGGDDYGGFDDYVVEDSHSVVLGGFHVDGSFSDDDVPGVIIQDNSNAFDDEEEHHIENGNGVTEPGIQGGPNFDEFGEDASGLIIPHNWGEFSDEEEVHGDGIGSDSDGSYVAEDPLSLTNDTGGNDSPLTFRARPLHGETSDDSDFELWAYNPANRWLPSRNFDERPTRSVAVPPSHFTGFAVHSPPNGTVGGQPPLRGLTEPVQNSNRRRDTVRWTVNDRETLGRSGRVSRTGSEATELSSSEDEIFPISIGSRIPLFIAQRNTGGISRTSNWDTRLGDIVRDGEEEGRRSEALAVQGTQLGAGAGAGKTDGGADTALTQGTDSGKGSDADGLEQKEKDGKISSKDGRNGDKELIKSLTDGFLCAICMDPWTNEGHHAVGCIPCGHLFGMSCITTWLRRQNPGKCPQCNYVCWLEDVRRIYGLPADEFQEKMRLLESKLSEMQFKVSSYEEAARNMER